MDFITQKRNGVLIADYDTQVLKAEFIAGVKEGMFVKESYTVPRRGKSWAQCKLLFGNMIGNAVKQANEKHITAEKFIRLALKWMEKDIPCGIPLDAGFVHQFMYIISPTFTEDGEHVTLSGMDTEQASRLFKVMQIFLASPGLEIIIKDPPDIE